MKLLSRFVLFFLLCATPLVAQTFRGTILGTVTDPQGAVVPGAKVRVHNIDTGLERHSSAAAGRAGFSWRRSLLFKCSG